MTVNEFEEWYKKEKNGFLRRKAQHLLEKHNGDFSLREELISRTIAEVFEKVELIKLENIESYIFIVMRSASARMIYMGINNTKICCGGDMGMSDWGLSLEDSPIIINQNLLIEPIEETRELTNSEKEKLLNFEKLSSKEREYFSKYVLNTDKTPKNGAEIAKIHKIRKKIKGEKIKRKPKPKSKNNIGRPTKEVYHYDNKGNLIQKYKTLEEASNKTSISKQLISWYCIGKRNPSNKHIWSYKPIENE